MSKNEIIDTVAHVEPIKEGDETFNPAGMKSDEFERLLFSGGANWAVVKFPVGGVVCITTEYLDKAAKELTSRVVVHGEHIRSTWGVSAPDALVDLGILRVYQLGREQLKVSRGYSLRDEEGITRVLAELAELDAAMKDIEESKPSSFGIIVKRG